MSNNHADMHSSKCPGQSVVSFHGGCNHLVTYGWNKTHTKITDVSV
jgi:hypothetical protein